MCTTKVVLFLYINKTLVARLVVCLFFKFFFVYISSIQNKVLSLHVVCAKAHQWQLRDELEIKKILNNYGKRH